LEVVTWGFGTRKEPVVIVVLSIILVIVSAAFILSVQNSKHWVVVGSWVATDPAFEQNYNLTTYQFTINAEEWRVSYHCTDYNYLEAYWHIEVINATSGSEIDRILRHELYGERYYSLKGTFLLNIILHGTLKNWDVSVEEFR
jgi:hypothetical protein